jgi:hypothetical protein
MTRKKEMKNIVISLIIVATLSLSKDLNSTVINIPADHPTIQAGIEVATTGDTVLAQPGTYFENIDFIGKAITVASMYITEADESYIHNTIIDGNQNGSCVKFESGEDINSVLDGFTVEHGSGAEAYIGSDLIGGGIYVFDSSPTVQNNIIQYNEAYSGAGLIATNTWEEGTSRPYLKNCTFRYNHAFYYGGGICTRYQSTIYFDDEELCNIYFNNAAMCNDLGGSGLENEPMVAYIDTFTVIEPDDFFFYSPYGSDQLFTNQSKIIPINQDLYVSAAGYDNNSGVSEDEPLQTIARALINIASNSDHPNTIHIAEGVYSPSQTEEKFPLNCRSYVSFSGADIEATTLDPESRYEVFKANDFENNYTIQNLSITNSSELFAESAIYLMQPNNVTVSNIRIHDYNRNGLSLATPAITDALHLPTSLYLNNVEISDNVGAKAASFGVIEDCVITNLIVRNNIPNYNADTISGGGIGFGGHPDFPDRYNYKLINSEITNNINATWEWPVSSSAIVILQRTNLDIVNCTIGDNIVETSDGGAVVLGSYDIDLNIYNSILYGDEPRELYLEDPYFVDEPCTVNISNSLIMGGEEDIEYGSTNVVNWLEGNIDADPLWQNSEDYPFALNELSPCIDAGTMDLPAGITLPEFDLAGNPRIYGGAVDMGAYEWSPVDSDNYELPITNYELKNYPNPFNPSTTISFTLGEDATQAEVKVYNIKGQLVKTLMDAQVSPGEFNIIWEGTDNQNIPVGNGIYFVKLNVDGIERSVKKITVMK